MTINQDTILEYNHEVTKLIKDMIRGKISYEENKEVYENNHIVIRLGNIYGVIVRLDFKRGRIYAKKTFGRTENNTLVILDEYLHKVIRVNPNKLEVYGLITSKGNEVKQFRVANDTH